MTRNLAFILNDTRLSQIMERGHKFLMMLPKGESVKKFKIPYFSTTCCNRRIKYVAKNYFYSLYLYQ